LTDSQSEDVRFYGALTQLCNSLYSQPNKRSATMIRKDPMPSITHPRCYIHQVNTHARTHSSYNVQITQNHHLSVVCRLQTANKPSISSFYTIIS